MDRVLLKQHVAANRVQDMVGLKFGDHRIAMYYQDAFRLAAGIRQSAKLAARYEGVRANLWNDHIEKALYDYKAPILMNPFYRRSEHRANFTKWRVGHEKNLVRFEFDELVVHIHYENAFELYGWLKNEAANAKRWAGDHSKLWSTRAALVDAEENDKILYTP